MSTISVRLPDYLHRALKEAAKKENVSMNQLIALALAEKLSALTTEEYLEKRAARGRKRHVESAGCGTGSGRQAVRQNRSRGLVTGQKVTFPLRELP